jgi:hypothetical protein
MQIVKVRLPAGDLSREMAAMREWLDVLGIDPRQQRHILVLGSKLVADFVCRLLNHMKEKGVRKVTPTHLLPKRGDKPEWQHTQDYWTEKGTVVDSLVDKATVVEVGGGKLIAPAFRRKWDQRFESACLRRGVRCELDSRRRLRRTYAEMATRYEAATLPARRCPSRSRLAN